MKKLKMLVAAFALSAAFVSCSDDDNDKASLGGKWYNLEMRVNGETFPYDDHEACGKDYVEFMSGGVGQFVDIWDCEEDAWPFTYERDGNTLTVSSFGETQTANIKKLTSSRLELEVVYDYDGDGNDDTVVEVYSRN